MGDRAVFMTTEVWPGIQGDPQPDYLVLYTHWGGYELESDLRQWLGESRSRWGDGPYLNRMLFSRMVAQDLMRETGYGIMVNTVPSDIAHDVLLLDHNQLRVYFIPRGKAQGVVKAPWVEQREDFESVAFEEFIKEKEAAEA